jgi:3-oxosteroid 1-dehydrogenase
MPFDLEYDLLVAGSGAGALTAALRARKAGARVLVVEKDALWGGTSGTSGGGIWIPGSHLAAAAGHPDDLDDAYRYVRALTAPNVKDEQVRSYVDNASKMLFWVEAEAQTHFAAMQYPDYYPETPGSREGFRTHLIYDSSPSSILSREAFDTMQHASPAASLFGRINWLMNETYAALLRPKGWQKVLGTMLARYWLDFPQRLRSGRDRRLTMGTALLGRLRAAYDNAGGELWLQSPVVSLINENGRVTGAVVRRQGRELRIGATKGVILAAGGFERNAKLRAEYLKNMPEPGASGGQIGNTGDTLLMAQQAGAATRNMNSAWIAPVFRFPGEVRSRLSTIERALPYSMIVDQSGKRYGNEALCYHRLGTLMAEKDSPEARTTPSWFVFDANYRARYPASALLPIIPDMLQSASVRKVLKKAGSIAELARKIGVEPAVLEATVTRFNRMAKVGKDEDFGRGDAAYDRLYGDARVTPNPSLGALERAPFYALPLHLGDIGTNGGLVTDGIGRVLRDDGSAIGGLYAVGNVAASVMGYAYPGAGSTLGTAMTFGYLAAAHAMGLNSLEPMQAEISEAG